MEPNPQVAALDRAAALDSEADTLDAEIQKTETEQAALESEVVELRAQIEDGDLDIGPEAIPERRRLIEHFSAVRKGLRKRRERAATEARLAKLAALRAEITAGTGHTSAELGKLAQKAHAAMAALATAANDHDQQLGAWQHQLKEFEVPRHDTPAPTPSPNHGGLGVTLQGELAAGRERYRSLKAQHVLDQIARAALRTAAGVDQGDEPLDELTAIHHTVPEQDPNTRYFRGTGGGIFEFGPEGPDENTARGLVHELGADEALMDWWAQETPTVGERHG